MFSEIRNLLQQAINNGVSFDEAQAIVESEIMNASEINYSVVREAISIASHYVSRVAIHSQRTRIFQAADRVSNDRERGTAALKKRVADLMAFRLPGGKAIADATGVECLSAASFYRKLSITNGIRANWLDAVARCAGDGLVREKVSETELQRLYESQERVHD